MKYLLIFEKFESTYLYHGSDVDFDEFSDEKISTGDASDMFGKGYYLTNNYDIAKHYAMLMAKKKYIIGYQKGIFDTEVPILSKEADNITDKEFKINKFEISGNILNVDTFELDEKFLNKIKEICAKYSHYPDEFQDKNFNRVIDWAKNHKHEIHNYRGELWYIISHLLFEDKKMVEDLVTYIKLLGYDGLKYRSDRSFEGINDWNYCIYNKNIIKKVKDINENIDEYYTNRKQIVKNNQVFYLCQGTGIEENVFSIEDLNGNQIGRATLNKDNYLDNIRIDEKYRRIGLATELYNFIEKVKDIKLNPSPIKQSKEIKNFWNKKIKNFESFNMTILLDIL